MADPMRIRAQASGDKATVRVLMSHEMESGQRKDANGKIVPAWFIQEVTALHNEKNRDDRRVGPRRGQESLLAVFCQRCESRRQNHHPLERQQGRQPQRRSNCDLIFPS